MKMIHFSIHLIQAVGDFDPPLGFSFRRRAEVIARGCLSEEHIMAWVSSRRFTTCVAIALTKGARVQESGIRQSDGRYLRQSD